MRQSSKRPYSKVFHLLSLTFIILYKCYWKVPHDHFVYFHKEKNKYRYPPAFPRSYIKNSAGLVMKDLDLVLLLPLTSTINLSWGPGCFFPFLGPSRLIYKRREQMGTLHSLHELWWSMSPMRQLGRGTLGITASVFTLSTAGSWAYLLGDEPHNIFWRKNNTYSSSFI